MMSLGTHRGTQARLVAVLVGVALAVGAGTSMTPAAVAASCSDFANQAAAQQGANTADPDQDDIYCESLPCPCSSPWHAQHDQHQPSPAPPPPSTQPVTGSTDAPAPGSLRSRVSPLNDPRGLHRGLIRVPRSMLAAARTLIAKVRTIARRGPKNGFDRDRFGPKWTDNSDDIPWARNGCKTRDDVLRRDLTQVTVRAGTHDCVITSGNLSNPYLGTPIRFQKNLASIVQIDHVIALSLAWQMGAAHWTTAKRVQLANDPLNLLAVDQHSNTQKGDSPPAEWLPANPTIRCAYSVRVAQVAQKYDLPLIDADTDTMQLQCTSFRVRGQGR